MGQLYHGVFKGYNDDDRVYIDYGNGINLTEEEYSNLQKLHFDIISSPLFTKFNLSNKTRLSTMYEISPLLEE